VHYKLHTDGNLLSLFSPLTQSNPSLVLFYFGSKLAFCRKQITPAINLSKGIWRFTDLLSVMCSKTGLRNKSQSLSSLTMKNTFVNVDKFPLFITSRVDVGYQAEVENIIFF